jgi:FAD/FMN-containing dehydrogenase
MTRLNQVKYNETEETVQVGAGCLFCEVYNHILPLGRNIVGGASIPGVGVGGWLLGGGYSLKTNQYGLGIDNIKEIQIVLPKGGKDAIRTVTDKSRDELGDLFWAIKVSFGFPPVTFLVSFAIYASGWRK